eukprot:537505-Prorocentrum_minimum.AAC.1
MESQTIAIMAMSSCLTRTLRCVLGMYIMVICRSMLADNPSSKPGFEFWVLYPLEVATNAGGGGLTLQHKVEIKSASG